MSAAIIRDWRLRLLLTAAIAFLAAFAGVFVAAAVRTPPPERLLDRIRPALGLSAAQEARLAMRRAAFEARRAVLEASIARHDVLLAAAIDREHRMGPEVRAAVRATQADIFRLQEEQIATLLAARTVLTPAQAATFDRMVREALTGR